MAIVDELKRLINAKGGSTYGVHTIAQACKVLAALAEEEQESNDDSDDNSDDNG